jgi:CRP-like cAMP-binding protein
MDLEHTDLFSDVAPEALSRIKELVIVRHYAADETIFAEGALATDVYILDRGRVELTYSLPQDPTTKFLITCIEPGENFAWSSLALGETLSSHARAMESSSVCVISAKGLHAIFVEHPDAGYRVMTKLSQQILTRLRDSRKKLRWLHQMGH